jgi:hypothetical protein
MIYKPGVGLVEESPAEETLRLLTVLLRTSHEVREKFDRTLKGGNREQH